MKMSKFNAHPHVPPWIESMNGELLSSTELDILNFIHYCKKHGCRTSNDRIASRTHFSHATVQRAIMKLYRSKLVEIDNFGKRTRKVKPIPWADRFEWQRWRDLFNVEHSKCGAPCATYYPPKQNNNPTGCCLGGYKRNPPPADGNFPSNARGLGGSKEGGIASLSYELAAKNHRDKLIQNGHPRNQANRLARVKFPKANFREDIPDGSETK